MGIATSMLQSRSVQLEKLTLQNPYCSWSSNIWWSWWQKLGKLDYPTISRSFQNPSSNMDEKDSSESTALQICRSLRSTSTRTVYFRYWYFPPRSGNYWFFSITLLRPFNNTSPTISTQNYFTPCFSFLKIQIRHRKPASRRYTFRGFFQDTTLWMMGTQHQNTRWSPRLQLCKDNWTCANQDPEITKQLIQKEFEDGFIEEIPDIKTAEKRWPQGIALGKLGVVHASNRDPRLVLDSIICGMNGSWQLPRG